MLPVIERNNLRKDRHFLFVVGHLSLQFVSLVECQRQTPSAASLKVTC